LSIVLFSFLAACGEDLNPVTLALQQNDPAKALALLNPLRSECGQASEFYELLGLANELSGNAPGAEEALRTAVSLDPKSPRVLTELGATYLRNGKPTEAAKVLDQAPRCNYGLGSELPGCFSKSAQRRIQPRCNRNLFFFSGLRRR
jgi:tetratricopeptide (TPR) repeat protein